MSSFNIVGEFDSAREDWLSYTERLQQFFAANDITNATKQRAILLSACGASTYQLIRNLLAPEKPSTKSFDELVLLVQNHLQPLPSVIVQRFNFHSRSRHQEETISQFMAELRKLAEHCEFGDSLNEMLRDRLVCGINDHQIQRRLLSEPKLSFSQALQIAQAAETAHRNTKELEKSAEVHALRRDRQSVNETRGPPKPPACLRCGGQHSAATCRFKYCVCHNCGKKGHLAKVCRGGWSRTEPKRHPSSPSLRGRDEPKETHCVEEPRSQDESDEATYTLFNTPGSRLNPMMVSLELDHKEVQMEVDTGASASIISEATYQKLWSRAEAPQLQPSTARLRTYTGEELKILGSITVVVKYRSQKERLKLLVVAGPGPSLMGRDWLTKIRLDWQQLNHVQSRPFGSLQAILDRHCAVFKDELGLVRGTSAKIQLKPGAQPRFCKARSVPHALRPRVEQELERLERTGVIEPVEFSEWAAPIVPVVKRDGSVRICGDYKLTINQAAKLDTYPLPRIDDLFASLSGGKRFTKLDLAHAYQQIELDEESRQLVVINTHRRLFRYNRLPFGIASAPAIFQRTMESILRDMKHGCVYIDDMLV